MTGVEGYIESASSGFVAGVNAARQFNGLSDLIFGEYRNSALARYFSPGTTRFQPMNGNALLIPWRKNQKQRYQAISKGFKYDREHEDP